MPVDRMDIIEPTKRIIECVDCGSPGGSSHADDCAGKPGLYRFVDREYISAADYVGAVADWERASQLAEWIVRDRREPDKVLMYARELEGITERRAGGQ